MNEELDLTLSKEAPESAVTAQEPARSDDADAPQGAALAEEDGVLQKLPREGDAYSPIEPSFRELPPNNGQEQKDYYATGTEPKKSKHPLIILLLLLLSACVIIIGMLLLSKAFNHQTEKKPAEPQSETNVLPTLSSDAPKTDERPQDVLVLSPAGGALTNEEIYEKIIDSTVVVMAVKDGVEQASSGVILTEDGYLLAHADCTSYADDLYIITQDGEQFDASFVGFDAPTEMVVLKIEAHDLVPAELGESEELRPGQAVLAIGNPYGQDMPGTLATGMVSAVSKDIAVGGLPMTVLQVNIPMISMQTGGLLLNQSGQVIGIGIAKAGSYSAENSLADIGFALPMHEAKSLLTDIIRYGCVAGRATMGLEVSEMTEPQKLYWGLPDGVMVERVSPTSSAFAAGMQSGDVLLSIDGIALTRAADYVSVLNLYQPGDVVRITLYRDGNYYYADICLDETVASSEQEAAQETRSVS